MSGTSRTTPWRNSDAKTRYLHCGILRWRLEIIAIALAALLCGIEVPPVHADVQDDDHTHWTGTVEVDQTTLTLNKGGRATYRLRLTEPPIAHNGELPAGWWVRIRVDGAVRIDGDYKGIHWVPSVGWEFDSNNYDQWREVHIWAEDGAAPTTVTFTHEVWETSTYCPVHNVGSVTVMVTDSGDGGGGGGGNGGGGGGNGGGGGDNGGGGGGNGGGGGDDGESRQPPALPALSVNDVFVDEGDRSAVFKVTLSAPSKSDVTVTFATSNGTARAGQDYTGTSGTLNIAAGNSMGTISVRVFDDDVVEADETFMVTLSAPTNATIFDGKGTGTIKNDDRVALAVSYGRSSYRVTEGSVAAVTVVLSEPPGRPIAIPLTHMPSGGAVETDYSGVPDSVRFDPSETQQTFSVQARKDAEYDDGERVILGFGILPSDIVLADPETSTIIIVDEPHSTDRVPRRWLRRFGDMAAIHLLDALDERVRCAPIQRSVPRLRQSPATRRGCEPRVGEPTALVIAGHRFPIRRAPSDASGLSPAFDGPAEAWIPDNRPLDTWGTHASRSLTAREVLTGTAAHFSFQRREDQVQEEGRRLSFWGRGALSRFNDDEDGTTRDAYVTSATFGVDYADHRRLAGVAFSHSEGDGSFSDDGLDGKAQSSLTGLYPYVYVGLNERISVWGVAGVGSGTLKLRMRDLDLQTDIAMRMGAVGVRREFLYAADNWGVSAALKADMLLMRIASNETLDLAAARATASRQRLAVEVAQEFTLKSGDWVVPFFEIGARRDGGDGETELGLEVGSGFRYEHPLLGWTAELDTRGLLRNTINEFDELGVAGSLRYDPIVNSALGPSFELSISGGVEGWLDPDVPWGYHTKGNWGLDDEETSDTRIDAEFGYGLPVFGGPGSRTPWVGASMSERWRALHLGYRLGFDSAIRMGVEGTLRQNAAGDEPSDYSIMLRLSVR